MSYFYITAQRPLSKTDLLEWLLAAYKDIVYEHTRGHFHAGSRFATWQAEVSLFPPAWELRIHFQRVST